jgi:hypothetical protein
MVLGFLNVPQLAALPFVGFRTGLAAFTIRPGNGTAGGLRYP